MNDKLFFMWKIISKLVVYIYLGGVFVFKKIIEHIDKTPESNLKIEFQIALVLLFILSGMLGYFGNEHWYMLTVLAGVKLLSFFDNKAQVKAKTITTEQSTLFLGASSFVWLVILSGLVIFFAIIMKIVNG